MLKMVIDISCSLPSKIKRIFVITLSDFLFIILSILLQICNQFTHSFRLFININMSINIQIIRNLAFHIKLFFSIQ